jgi:hypothetical protein
VTPAEVEAIKDPDARAHAAQKAIQTAEAEIEALRFLRNVAFAELHTQRGESVRSIAQRYGVSKTLVATITG